MSFVRFAAAVAVSAIGWGGVAGAAPLNITGNANFGPFESFTPDKTKGGLHGLEVRGGNNATNGDWEIGVGNQTSVPGQFNQGQWAWGPTGAPTVFNFSYAYAHGIGTFTIGDSATSVTWGAGQNETALKNGNAVQIFAKRGALATITEFDGHLTNLVIGSLDTGSSNTLLFYSLGFLDGFTLKGQLQLVGGSGSANEFIVKAGNVVAPIPLPAAAWMLLAGMAALGAAGRRRARA